ncbi:MAG: Vi polysaccharide biosynthesis UDP-N-acetylglucosamine C-6 dehydrogenase TviB [Rhodocyclaceae bacterium]|nr:Vi polysaccharide biosynthesis UDP-N-acetylglucosamine C-6 dehydrogenase TviB [Rhodocyclaceae bacterium]
MLARKLDDGSLHLGVVGLGYVGLPLAVEFGKHFKVTGFDVKPRRLAELRRGYDATLQVGAEDFAAAGKLAFTGTAADLRACDVFIVTVPTPVDRHKRPDLSFLIGASEAVGKVLRPGAVVIYESTVYPGATEEDCVPVLERCSGLTFNVDFCVGYSPERINPGDGQHRIAAIRKITSGSTPASADFVDALYRKIITAGTHKASSIRVAEAAKVIENTQRDVNIALINELAIIFQRLGLDTEEILDAAGSKWNFLPFRPGLVGGHCIGVDPYYLTHKAQEVGYHPEVILAGRRINDNMGAHVAIEVVKLMTRRAMPVVGARILVMGLAYKENCPDVRNTRVVDIVRELHGYNAEVDIYDPWVNGDDAELEYGLRPIAAPELGRYDAIVIAVGHRQFKERGAAGIRAWGKAGAILYDVKYLLPAADVDGRL